MENELQVLSITLSKMEFALHEYALFPKNALNSLHSHLLTLQADCCIDYEPLHSRFNLYLAAVKTAIEVGSIYDRAFHLALSQALDALTQFCYASTTDKMYEKQMAFLLSSERPCWKKLSFTADVFLTPAVGKYEALWNNGSLSLNDSLLDELSSVGKVSLFLEEENNSGKTWRILLSTRQSMLWLRERFAGLSWRLCSYETEETLLAPGLHEESHRLLFSPSLVSNASRSRHLSCLENDIRNRRFARFDSLFSQYGVTKYVDRPEQWVPVPEVAFAMGSLKGRRLTPVRESGSYYAHIVWRNSWDKLPIHLACSYLLGRDVLPSFLYILETDYGVLAFDQKDCLGAFSRSAVSLRLEGGRVIGCEFSDGLFAQIPQNLPLVLSERASYCQLPEYISHVLLIKQYGLHFALPYSSITEEEGVCAQAHYVGGKIKNVWLNARGKGFIEPYIVEGIIRESVVPFQKAVTPSSTREGFYCIRANKCEIWIEAQLVCQIGAYQSPIASWFDQNTHRVNRLFLHEGHYYQYSINVLDENSEACLSLILDCRGKSLVINTFNCEWSDSVIDNMIDMEVSLDKMQEKYSEFGVFLESEGKIIINKNNWLPFIDFCSH